MPPVPPRLPSQRFIDELKAEGYSKSEIEQMIGLQRRPPLPSLPALLIGLGFVLLLACLGLYVIIN